MTPLGMIPPGGFSVSERGNRCGGGGLRAVKLRHRVNSARLETVFTGLFPDSVRHG